MLITQCQMEESKPYNKNRLSFFGGLFTENSSENRKLHNLHNS